MLKVVILGSDFMMKARIGQVQRGQVKFITDFSLSALALDSELQSCRVLSETNATSEHNETLGYRLLTVSSRFKITCVISVRSESKAADEHNQVSTESRGAWGSESKAAEEHNELGGESRGAWGSESKEHNELGGESGGASGVVAYQCYLDLLATS